MRLLVWRCALLTLCLNRTAPLSSVTCITHPAQLRPPLTWRPHAHIHLIPRRIQVRHLRPFGVENGSVEQQRLALAVL